MSKPDVKVIIGGDNTLLKKSLDSSKKLVSSATKQITKSIGVASVAIGAGMVAAAAGAYALNEVLQEGIALANTQEEAEVKLAAVLTATGHAAGFTAEELNKMAGELQGVTTFGDEATIAAMAILATFKEIKGDNFKEATIQAQNMATVLGTDLNSAMVQLGKALNDPITGLSMLTRSGVSFTEAQKEVIKGMQASGDIMGAQKVILRELSTQFGGTAVAMRTTFGGSVTAAKNALGDLKEEIGFVITKTDFFKEAAQLAETYFIQWGTAIANNRESLGELSKTIVERFVGSINIVLETMRFFTTAWINLEIVANGSISVIADGVYELTKTIRGILLPLDEAYKGLKLLGIVDVNPFDTMVLGALEAKKEFENVTVDLYSDLEKINTFYDRQGASIEKLKKEISALGTESKKTTDIQVEGNTKVIASANELARVMEKTVKDTVTSWSLLNDEMGKTHTAFSKISLDAGDIDHTIRGATEAVQGLDGVWRFIGEDEPPIIEQTKELVTEEQNLYTETIQTTAAFREQESVMQGATAATDELAGAFNGLANAQGAAANEVPRGSTNADRAVNKTYNLKGANYDTGDPATDAALRLQNRQTLFDAGKASNAAIFDGTSYVSAGYKASAASKSSQDVDDILAAAGRTVNIYVNEKIGRNDITAIASDLERYQRRA